LNFNNIVSKLTK
jgi:hypothetical protein